MLEETLYYRPVGQAVPLTCSFLELEVWVSNLRPVKLDTMLPAAFHPYNITLKEAVLAQMQWCKFGPHKKSLHDSVVMYWHCTDTKKT